MHERYKKIRQELGTGTGRTKKEVKNRWRTRRRRIGNKIKDEEKFHVFCSADVLKYKTNLTSVSPGVRHSKTEQGT